MRPRGKHVSWTPFKKTKTDRDGTADAGGGKAEGNASVLLVFFLLRERQQPMTRQEAKGFSLGLFINVWCAPKNPKRKNQHEKRPIETPTLMTLLQLNVTRRLHFSKNWKLWIKSSTHRCCRRAKWTVGSNSRWPGSRRCVYHGPPTRIRTIELHICRHIRRWWLRHCRKSQLRVGDHKMFEIV